MGISRADSMASSSLSENFQSFGRSSVWYCICLSHSGGRETRSGGPLLTLLLVERPLLAACGALAASPLELSVELGSSGGCQRGLFLLYSVRFPPIVVTIVFSPC